jgi:hypothetical protein
MQVNYSNQLYEAATRVLRRCASGHHPRTKDVQLFQQHSPPGQIGMRPAELAGVVIWISTHRAMDAE